MEHLKGARLYPVGGDVVDVARGVEAPAAIAATKVDFVCFFFAARFCPPCRRFAPKLAEFCRSAAARDAVRIVLVPFDRADADERPERLALHSDWLRVGAQSREAKYLKKKFVVTSIPSLIVCRPDGKVLTRDGRIMLEEHFDEFDAQSKNRGEEDTESLAKAVLERWRAEDWHSI